MSPLRLVVLFAVACLASSMAPAWGRQTDPDYSSSPHAPHHHARSMERQGADEGMQGRHRRDVEPSQPQGREQHRYEAPTHFRMLGNRVEYIESQANTYARRVLGY